MALGSSLLIIGLITGVYAALASAIGSYRGDESWLRSGRLATYVVAAVVGGATVLLGYYFLTDNFAIAYVAQNSMSTQPLIYKISGVWGGQGGSLLLWAGYLAVFAAIVAKTRQKPGLSGYASSLIMLTEVFFLALIIFNADPFESSVSFWSNLSGPPVEGMGLNPLLINPGMLFHPPTLYAGYAGFVIPFAFAMAGLLTRDDDWVLYTRKWSVFAWLFLGIGILVGGWWAYVILGWGGYWAWDPVENGSLMPWLTGTAFLHSVMIQEKRGGLRVWNQVLILLTYVLTVYGVFLTRSGVVESVHTFAQSGVDLYFSAFMAVALIFGLGLMTYRWGYLRSEESIADSYLSKEVSFLFNNLVLLATFFAVWWGTSFPFLSELLIGQKISIGTSFFNEVTPPFAVALLVLMGICPLIPWGKASIESLKDSFTYPLVFGLLGGVIGFLQGPVGALILGVVSFVVATHLLDTYRAYAVVKRHNPENDPLRLLFRLVARNRRRYGGYLVHIGILFIVVGVAWSSAYAVEEDIAVRQGESVQVPGGYTATFVSVAQSSYPDHSEAAAVLDVYRGGEQVYTARPSIGNYPRREIKTRNPDIWSTATRDLYFIFNGVTGGVASITVKLNPFVYFIWIGGYLMMGGGAVALWPEFSSRGEELEKFFTTTELLSKRVYDEQVVLTGKVKRVENESKYALTDGDSEMLVEGGGQVEDGDAVLIRGRFDGEVFHVEAACPECGGEVTPRDSFCGSCGEDLT